MTIRYGFNNVIDAFHIVGQKEMPKRSYTDERKENKGIRIIDEFKELLEREWSMGITYEK